MQIPQAQLNEDGYIVTKMVEEGLQCSWCKQDDCICDDEYQIEAENNLTD